MTAVLAVDYVEPPTYEEWCESQWQDDTWWEWVMESQYEHYKERGIAIDTGEFMFDLYHNACAGKGHIFDDVKFADFYYDRLAKVSFVFAEMFKHKLIEFKWGYTRNGQIECSYYDDWGGWSEDAVFKVGFFQGMRIQDLFDAERDVNECISADFEEELVSIINSIYGEILDTLKVEDEYRTSTEEYEEWVKNCWNP